MEGGGPVLGEYPPCTAWEVIFLTDLYQHWTADMAVQMWNFSDIYYDKGWVKSFFQEMWWLLTPYQNHYYLFGACQGGRLERPWFIHLFQQIPNIYIFSLGRSKSRTLFSVEDVFPWQFLNRTMLTLQHSKVVCNRTRFSLFLRGTFPETNIAPENGWLEY